MGGESLVRLPFLFREVARNGALTMRRSGCERCGTRASHTTREGTRFMTDITHALKIGTTAARDAGALLRQHFGKPPEVNELLAHDIKLALDVQTQELITKKLLGA